MNNQDRFSGKSPAMNSQGSGNYTNNKMYGGTVSGIRPDDKVEPYEITTTEIKRWLQEKLDVVVASVNQKLQEKKKAGQIDASVPPMPQIQINAYTIRMSDWFYPIMITFPESAIYKPERKQRKKQQHDPNRINILDIQDSCDNDTSYQLLYTPIWQMFKEFRYENVHQSFNSPEVRRSLGITAESGRQVIAYSKTRISKIGGKNNGSLIGMLMIDPYHVIHDMLIKETDTRPFTISMKKVDKLKDGEYRYRLNRTILTGGKRNKGGSEFQHLMNKIFSGGGSSLN